MEDRSRDLEGGGKTLTASGSSSQLGIAISNQNTNIRKNDRKDESQIIPVSHRGLHCQADRSRDWLQLADGIRLEIGQATAAEVDSGNIP